MKYYILFVFIFSLNAFSQQSGIADGSWYLYNMVIDGENNLSHFNDSGYPVTTIFFSNNESYFSTEFCDSHAGLINYNSENPTFTISEFSHTLEGCDTTGSIGNIDTNLVLESAHIFTSFFFNSNVFTYEIIEENQNHPKELIITSTNGDYIIYRFELLSNLKYAFNLPFSLYPNPVKNELNLIIPSKNLKNIKTKIFDLSGKLIQENTLQNTKSINVESLKNGFYFIVIEDELVNIGIQKFVK